MSIEIVTFTTDDSADTFAMTRDEFNAAGGLPDGWSDYIWQNDAKDKESAIANHQTALDEYNRVVNAIDNLDSTANMTVNELRAAGYYVFIAEPHTDFNPENFNEDGVGEGMNIAFSECLWGIDAQPLDSEDESNASE